jgi:hypothetical protein
VKKKIQGQNEITFIKVLRLMHGISQVLFKNLFPFPFGQSQNLLVYDIIVSYAEKNPYIELHM